MDMVIGIGNDLRGDDGIGPHVVNAVRPRSDVETVTIHQLVPELAQRIHSARRALFVDASLDRECVSLGPIEPSEHRGLGHACTPAALLGWTKLAYARVPESWLLQIPGTSFRLGEPLSVFAKSHIPDAMERIEEWLNSGSRRMQSEEEA